MLKKIILGILLVGILGFGATQVTKYMPSKEQIDPLTYFSEFKDGQQNMVFNDIRVEWDEPVLIKNDVIYVEIGWLREFVSDRVYYDVAEEVVSITNLEEVIRVNLNENTMTINKQAVPLTIDIIQENGKAYIAETYVEQEYAVTFELGEDQRLVMATTNQGEEVVLGEIKRKSVLRTHADSQKPILDKVSKGEQVMIYGQAGSHLRVRNENGIVGYIPENHVKQIGDVPELTDAVYEAKPIAEPLDDKVKLIWDQMTVRMVGDWSGSKYANVSRGNVISPTWFEFADGEGNLIDRGTLQYSQEAQERGLQVWPLMSHNFSEPQYTREILTSTAKRQHVIDQLLELVQKYDTQGINIDIENIQPDFSAEWVQFMRELYPQMQAIGKTVSVDVYMPSAWSGHYERTKISEVVDYFMVMAYDQHWSGSEEAGPTAGLGWVEEGIIANLEEVPSEKLVLGIPFFTRVWEETEEGLKSSAYGMQAAQNIAKGWGAEYYYDDQHKQNYVQHYSNDTLYHIWLEDDATIKRRVDLINTYDLAGYAVWKLGLETPSVWNELEDMQ